MPKIRASGPWPSSAGPLTRQNNPKISARSEINRAAGGRIPAQINVAAAKNREELGQGFFLVGIQFTRPFDGFPLVGNTSQAVCLRSFR
jgi:hypothetical protein